MRSQGQRQQTGEYLRGYLKHVLVRINQEFVALQHFIDLLEAIYANACCRIFTRLFLVANIKYTPL